MKTIKTYQSINSLHYITNIAIGNTIGVIEFKGGTTTPTQKNGIFRTHNNTLQQAIESDVNFNREFRLISQVDAEPTNTNEEAEASAKKAAEHPAIEECTTVEGVTNKQKAIEWIRKNLNLIVQPNTPAVNILAIARERNIIFKDWQIYATPNTPQ